MSRVQSRPAPAVSIVCPAYNEVDAIAGAIERLRACLDTPPVDTEVLIINDGSTDSTVMAARRSIGADSRFRILSHKANFGPRPGAADGLQGSERRDHRHDRSPSLVGGRRCSRASSTSSSAIRGWTRDSRHFAGAVPERHQAMGPSRDNDAVITRIGWVRR